MDQYEIRFTRESIKDFKKLPKNLKEKLKDIIINRISIEPFSGKKLIGDLKGLYSVRLSYRDRIVYSVDESHKIVFIHRVRTHYSE